MMSIVQILFVADVTTLFILLLGVLWSVAKPRKRIWPPPGRRSWQYALTWIGFYVVFALNAALFVLDWNAWIFDDGIRLVLGIPLSIVGAMLVSWGIIALGTKNTSGLKARFIPSGPYRFMRNPQYLGDSILFIGLSIIANSAYLWITHLLLVLVLLIAPLAEESWLEEQYGDTYLTYKGNTSRFL